jgi:hypothetical protein
MLGLVALTGPYLVAAIGFAAAAAAIGLGLRHDGPLGGGTLGPLRRGQPINTRGAMGLAVLMVANLVMVGVMTMAPVHLHHSGSGLTAIGIVISLHIAGMFAPSPLSGWVNTTPVSDRTPIGWRWR